MSNIRIARNGETSRPVVRFNGRLYETLARPTMAGVGSKVKISTRNLDEVTIAVAKVGTEGWQLWERQ